MKCKLSSYKGANHTAAPRSVLRNGTVPPDASVSRQFAAENLEVPGLSFNGDRESVVEQWLKRNQQILAGLDI